MVRRFCPKCGNNLSKEDMTLGFICKQCKDDENPLYDLESEYRITFCENCNSYKLCEEKDTNKWTNNNEKDPLKILKKSLIEEISKKKTNVQNISYEIEIDQESLESSNWNYVMCKIKGSNENNTSIKTEFSKINIKKGICVNCVNLLGKRFNCVIQLRKGSKNDNIIDEILNKIIEFVEKKHSENSEHSIVEIVDTNNGFDIKLSTIGILKKIYSYINSKYNFIVKKSKKLVGVNPNTGGKLYRTYLLLRTLPIYVGDLIEIKNKQYFVKNISQKSVQLENVKTKVVVHKKFNFFEKITIKILPY